MEPGYHPADDQRPGDPVQHIFRQPWDRHHYLYVIGPRGTDPPDGEAEPPAKGDDRLATQTQRGAGALRQGQTKDLPRDNEDLSRGGGKPHWMSRPHIRPVPRLDRSLSDDPSDGAIHTRQSGWAFSTPLLMAPSGAPCNPPGCLIPVARPGGTGQLTVPNRSAGVGWRFHVGYAEDDDHAVRRLPAGVHKPNDAVDDAYYVRVLHHVVPKWAGPVLGGVQYGGHSDSRIRYGLGAHNVTDLTSSNTGAAAGPCTRGRRGGDNRR